MSCRYLLLKTLQVHKRASPQKSNLTSNLRITNQYREIQLHLSIFETSEQYTHQKKVKYKLIAKLGLLKSWKYLNTGSGYTKNTK